MKRILSQLLLALAIAVGAVHAAAQDGRSERVHFAGGASSKLIKGKIQGYHYVDYLVRAGAGQTLSVALKSGNGANHFNLIAPGAGDSAMFVGSMSGNSFSGMLPADGDYKIRVYLMRNAARRNEVARYTLDVGISGAALMPTPAAQDALVPGTPFHAAAQVPCTVPYAPEVKTCQAFVIRRGFDGTATVEVRWGQGQKRRMLFVRHDVLAADSVDAPDFERRSESTIVRFGSDERYEIPEALISGG